MKGADPCAPHMARESPGQDGGCFQFDLGRAIEQLSDENHRKPAQSVYVAGSGSFAQYRSGFGSFFIQALTSLTCSRSSACSSRAAALTDSTVAARASRA